MIAILLPALSAARQEANRVKCLSNMRNMAFAQAMYVADNRGWLVQAGLGHGSEVEDEELTWFNTLNRYYTNKLVARCPSDISPFWDLPVAGSNPPRFRRTSYGLNGFLVQQFCPWGPGFSEVPANGLYKKIEQIRRPSETIQFVEMIYGGQYAAADHTHPNLFATPTTPDVAIPARVNDQAKANSTGQVQINAHGRPRRFAGWDSVANYAYLDGHAASERLRDVFGSIYINRFDPASPQPKP
jgi:prepilin-type processing-associated H-X9-DG protein